VSAEDPALARLAELAVDDLLDALDADELLEYRALRGEHPEFDPYGIEQATAILLLAAGVTPVPLPGRLEVQLADAAQQFFGLTTSVAPQSRMLAWLRYGGVCAVAASLLLTVWIRLPRLQKPSIIASNPPHTSAPAPISSPIPHDETKPKIVAAAPDVSSADIPRPAADRAFFLKQHPSLWQRALLPGPDPTGQGVSGDVVWDARSQTGYLRFRGLRPNNPNVDQYQLWIFDARRDPRFPVDGGVFNVTAGRDDVVAFKAKLNVEVPLMFVITVEARGGVVVSDRQRIAAVASSG